MLGLLHWLCGWKQTTVWPHISLVALQPELEPAWVVLGERTTDMQVLCQAQSLLVMVLRSWWMTF